MSRIDAANVERVVALLEFFKCKTGVRVALSSALADRLEAIGIHEGFVRIEELTPRVEIQYLTFDELQPPEGFSVSAPVYMGVDLGSGDESVFYIPMEPHGARLEVPSDQEPQSRFRRFDMQHNSHPTRPSRAKYLKSWVKK